MPLLKRKIHHLAEPPNDLRQEDEVYVVRFTGEVFREYEDYLEQIRLYRQRLWTCKYSGKSNLTYEEALASEEKSSEKVQSFPDCYKGFVLRAVHHSTFRLEELTSAIYAKVRDDYLPGEEILAENNFKIQRCRVIRQVASGGRSGLDNGRAYNEEGEELQEDAEGNGEPQYEVEWLAGVGLDSRTSVIPKSSIKRKKHPLPRTLLRSWISSVASQGSAKGSPWIVTSEYVQRYGLPQKLPQSIIDAQQRAKLKEQQQKAASREAARAKAEAKGREKSRLAHEDSAEHGNGWNNSETPSSEQGVRTKVAKEMRDAPVHSKRVVTPTLKAAALETFRPYAAKVGLPTPGTKKQRSNLGGKLGDGDVSARVDTESAYEDDYQEGMQAVKKKTSKHPSLEDGTKQKKKKKSADEDGSLNLHKKVKKSDKSSQGAGLKVKTKGGIKNVLGGLIHKDKLGLKLKGKKFALPNLDGKVKQKRSQIKEGAGQKRKLGATDSTGVKKLRVMLAVTPSASSDEGEDEESKIINKERCSECRRGVHPAGSELLMCDACPRSYHLACLALDSDNVPEGEWKCPKCVEKEEARQRRLEELEQRIREKEGRERVKLEEKEEKERKRVKEKEEREAKERQKQEEKEEKERKRLEDKEEKERKKQEEKEAKEQQRKEEREKRRHEQLMEKRKRLYPMEDLQVLVEEAKDAARAAKWATASGTQLAVPSVRAPRPLPQPLGQVLGAAGGKVMPTMFGDVMELWDFCQAFGKMIKSPQPSLQDLVGTLVEPGASNTLVDMYMAIFKALLVAGGGQSPGGMVGHGVTEDVLDRWKRHLDKATWQEIIRRYLARGNQHIPEALQDAIKEFGQKDWADVSYATHLEVIRCVWDDYLDSDSVREFLESNIEAAVQLQKDKYNEEMEEKRLQNEEKKREKEEKKAAKAAKKAAKEAKAAARKAWKDAMERGEAMEGEEPPEDVDGSDDEKEDKQKEEQEPDFEVPEDVRQYGGDPNDRRAILAHKDLVRREEARLAKAKVAWIKKKEVEKKAEQKAQEDEQKRREKALRAEEEARRKKEEAYEKEMSKLALRSQYLGWDRHHNRYWWFAGDKSFLFVEEGLGFPKLGAGLGEESETIKESKSRWFCYTSKEELDCLMAYLNPKGIRELALKTSLQKYYWQLSQNMKRNRRGGVLLEGMPAPGTGETSAANSNDKPTAMEDLKRLPVSCNLVHGDYIVDDELIVCNCESCDDKPDVERQFKLGEFEPHVGCRTRNAQASIRVELPGQKGLPLIKWLEDREEERMAEAAAAAEAEAAAKVAPAQAAQTTLASLEASAYDLQGKLENRGLGSQQGWASWKRQFRAAANSVTALKPLLLQLEDAGYELGEPFPEPELEPDKEGEVDGGAPSEDKKTAPVMKQVEANGGEIDEIGPTVSEYEEQQVEQGEDDSADAAGQLWRTQEMRNVWRNEMKHAETLSWLTYLLYTLSERCEPLFEIHQTARSTGKRSARVPARPPAKRAKQGADVEEDEEASEDLHQPVWDDGEPEMEVETNVKPSRRQRSAITATATPSTAKKGAAEDKLVKAECAKCQKPMRQAAASSLQPCSSCDLRFHLACVGLKSPPGESWLCPACETAAASAHTKKGARSSRGPPRREKEANGEAGDAPVGSLLSDKAPSGQKDRKSRREGASALADQPLTDPKVSERRLGRTSRRRGEDVPQATAAVEEDEEGGEIDQSERASQRRTRGSAVDSGPDVEVRELSRAKRSKGSAATGVDVGTSDSAAGNMTARSKKTRGSEAVATPEAVTVGGGGGKGNRGPIKKRHGNGSAGVGAGPEAAAESPGYEVTVSLSPAMSDKKARSGKRKSRGASQSVRKEADDGVNALVESDDEPPARSTKTRVAGKNTGAEPQVGVSKKGKQALKVVTGADEKGKENVSASTPRDAVGSARAREVCGECKKNAKTGGEAVTCATCRSMWHTECMQMRRSPKGAWFCQTCRNLPKK